VFYAFFRGKFSFSFFSFAVTDYCKLITDNFKKNPCNPFLISEICGL